MASVTGGQPIMLVEAASRAEYAAGRLLYVEDGSLMVQPFDPAARRLTGEPQRKVERVGAGVSSTIDAAFSMSANGTLAYWEGRTAPLADVAWLDRAGRRLGTAVTACHYRPCLTRLTCHASRPSRSTYRPTGIRRMSWTSSEACPAESL